MMAVKKASDPDSTMHKKASQDGEHSETQVAENGNAKHDLEKSSLSQVAIDDQEYFVTIKTWLVVWVRNSSSLCKNAQLM